MKLIIPTLFTLMLISCRSQPPSVAILVEPKGDEVIAGTKLRLFAKTPLTKENVSFSWSASGACAEDGEFSAQTFKKVYFTPQATCPGGEIEFKVDVTTEKWNASAVKKLRILPSEKAPKPLVPFPDPLPENWKMLNSYNLSGEKRLNDFGGFYGTWNYRGSRCEIVSTGDSASKSVLQVKYFLPRRDSLCGHYEYLKGEEGKPEPVDISEYKGFAFVLKSGDGRDHWVRWEVVEFDPYQTSFQGYIAATRAFKAGKNWTRYDVPFANFVTNIIDMRRVKQIGLKIERTDGNGTDGTILIDNLALYK